MAAYSRRDLSRFVAAAGASLLAGKALAQAASTVARPPLPANAAGLSLDHIVLAVPILTRG